jgi:hypothetical protein
VTDPHAACRLAIEHLTDAEAELRERVADLEADVQAYRLLAQQAIHALAALTGERDRLVGRLRELRNLSRAVADQERAA